MTLTKKSTLSDRKKEISGGFRSGSIDMPFFVAMIVTLLIGLMMLYSAGFAVSLYKTEDSYTYIRKQVIMAGVGLAAMAIVIVFPFRSRESFRRFLRGVTVVGYLVSLVLLVLPLVFSHDDEKRWLYIGSFQFQPSDIMKVFLVLACAMVMSRDPDEKNHLFFILNRKFKLPDFLVRIADRFIFPLAIVGMPVLLVVLEPHLSGTVLMFLVGMFTIFAGGFSGLLELPVFALAGVTGYFYALSKPYMAKRLTSFVNPFEDILGSGHQAYQSLISIGSGGLFGLGYGESRQKYLFLPEAHNDFIFAIVAEELGFVGVILIMLLFGFLVWRGLYIARHLEDKFYSLIVFGLTCQIAVQTLLNFIVVSGLGPTTGISLPFFSYGGTAMLVLMGEMGLILRLSREAYTK